LLGFSGSSIPYPSRAAGKGRGVDQRNQGEGKVPDSANVADDSATGGYGRANAAGTRFTRRPGGANSFSGYAVEGGVTAFARSLLITSQTETANNGYGVSLLAKHPRLRNAAIVAQQIETQLLVAQVRALTTERDLASQAVSLCSNSIDDMSGAIKTGGCDCGPTRSRSIRRLQPDSHLNANPNERRQ
jgi:hypothetical protein